MNAFPALFDAADFARAWAEAWNRRDVETVLGHFAADAVFTSPVAQAIGYSADGVVRGKQALRRYWAAALARNPDLHFTVTRVFSGIDTVVIAYRAQTGEDRAEVLTFEAGLIVRGSGMFATPAAAPPFGSAVDGVTSAAAEQSVRDAVPGPRAAQPVERGSLLADMSPGLR